jgi:hypothetical protein
MVDDAQTIVKGVLKELTDLAADDTVGPILKRNIFETEPNLVDAMSYLPTAFFGRQVAFEDGKSRIEFQKEEARPILGHLHQRKSFTVFGEIMGATFFMGDNSTLDSRKLAEALADVFSHEAMLAQQPFTENFDKACSDLLHIVLTLLQWSVRGKPRASDMNVANCGSTNAYDNFVKSDSFCHALGDKTMKDIIFATMFRFPQVKYLERLINRNQANSIDFGKVAKDAMENCNDARFLLINQMTKLTSNIHIHKKIIAKPLNN